jgi:serine/threonine-protein phosphatase PPG1
MLDLDQCISRLFQRQLLAEVVIRDVCVRVQEILLLESNIKHISTPVTVVGDIHG